MLFILVGAAEAIDGDCPDPNACATGAKVSPVVTPPTMRDSIENAKSDIAKNIFGLQLSAFGDVSNNYDDSGKRKLDSTFELDASADFGDDLQGALALVNEKVGTSMPVGFLDFHTFGGRIAPRGRLWVEKGLHIQVGRFDVPFGNDWQFYASKDSVSIARPLTTDLVMGGGYNDKGMRVLGNNGSVNFNAFILRGFNAGRLIGGRLGLTPFSDPFSLISAKEPKTFEFGLSYFYDANASWKKNEAGYAADAEVFLDDWHGRFEYMVRKKEPRSGVEGSVLRGWHFTQEYLIGDAVAWPTTIFVRYEQGALSPPDIATMGVDAGDARDVRVAAGSKTNLGSSDVFQLKFEVQHYRSATPTTRAMPGFSDKLIWYMQLVVAL
jgi:hypothetical protein